MWFGAIEEGTKPLNAHIGPTKGPHTAVMYLNLAQIGSSPRHDKEEEDRQEKIAHSQMCTAALHMLYMSYDEEG